MLIEDQLWEGLCRQINYATPLAIAKRLKLNHSTVKHYILVFYKKGFLSMKVHPVKKVKMYKIKD